MRYKLLGRTGLRVSELCLGAMIFGFAAVALAYGGTFDRIDADPR